MAENRQVDCKFQLSVEANNSSRHGIHMWETWTCFFFKLQKFEMLMGSIVRSPGQGSKLASTWEEVLISLAMFCFYRSLTKRFFFFLSTFSMEQLSSSIYDRNISADSWPALSGCHCWPTLKTKQVSTRQPVNLASFLHLPATWIVFASSSSREKTYYTTN